ncbi:hypothetical protein ACFX5E_05485 [Flavobacterium sp. LS2P90]|uniref:Natural product n=1 Tax=Flavobacterium xylosi TaxID=3230415 RepID=A0ABW6HVD7_9FLAO
MLKNILNLEGAQRLTKNEQKLIKGGLQEMAIDDGGACKKCCWAGTTNCSTGVEGGTSCVAGAVLTNC